MSIRCGPAPQVIPQPDSLTVHQARSSVWSNSGNAPSLAGLERRAGGQGYEAFRQLVQDQYGVHIVFGDGIPGHRSGTSFHRVLHQRHAAGFLDLDEPADSVGSVAGQQHTDDPRSVREGHRFRAGASPGRCRKGLRRRTRKTFRTAGSPDGTPARRSLDRRDR
jgi:hypothetical protein